jgi:DNA-binding NarL/FixJ family response regulator
MNTVKTNTKNIYRKLGVRGRENLIAPAGDTRVRMGERQVELRGVEGES